MTGAHGQLGRQLARKADDHASTLALGALDLDISDAIAVADVIRPGDVVVNCAAYTAVDVAEADVDAAYAANEAGPRNLARACGLAGARLIHISTDYVFDGTATEPYETDATPAPLNVYGQSKLAGERAVHVELPSAQIVRTSWVYTGTGSDFVAVMLRKLREGAPVRVVADQLGSPTYSGDLADALLELVATPSAATMLHATGGGTATWYDLARAVFEESGADPDEWVRPCETADYPTPARRPAYSVLSNRSWIAAGLTPLPNWRDGLRTALAAAPGTIPESAR